VIPQADGCETGVFSGSRRLDNRSRIANRR
jgi:hypothetical protein